MPRVGILPSCCHQNCPSRPSIHPESQLAIRRVRRLRRPRQLRRLRRLSREGDKVRVCQLIDEAERHARVLQHVVEREVLDQVVGRVDVVVAELKG